MKASPPTLRDSRRLRRECANIIIDLHRNVSAGHISSSLCISDILIFLHFYVMNKQDTFILSKGHSALALYSILFALGKISKKLFETCYQDGTLLGAHPPCGLNKVPGILFGTGSLGHGLSLAAGVALSNKLKGRRGVTYCLISDGECDEGSIWEAALFAGHHQLKNLVVIIDDNGMQALGKTSEVLNLEPLDEKWRSFGFDVAITDGHDISGLQKTLARLSQSSKPQCIIAKTHPLISFMKKELRWHYTPFTEGEYAAAKEEINAM